MSEWRPGVYVFGDAQQVELGGCAWDDVALWAEATVVGRTPGGAVLDAGSKVLSGDRPGWASGYGRLPDRPEARVVALAEHHATVDAGGGPLPGLGARIRVVPNHVCAAVNLADDLVVRAGGAVVDVWPVDARGANR